MGGMGRRRLDLKVSNYSEISPSVGSSLLEALWIKGLGYPSSHNENVANQGEGLPPYSSLLELRWLKSAEMGL